MKAIIALGLWLSVITILSLMPSTNTSIRFFPHEDKVVHAIFYFGMAFLIMNVLKSKNFRAKWSTALLISIAYGILMEVLQETICIGRYFDSFDIIANIIGALLGCAAFKLLHSKLPNK